MDKRSKRTTRRDVRRARKAFELGQLQRDMEDNQRRIDELKRLRSGPCPICAERAGHAG